MRVKEYSKGIHKWPIVKVCKLSKKKHYRHYVEMTAKEQAGLSWERDWIKWWNNTNNLRLGIKSSVQKQQKQHRWDPEKRTQLLKLIEDKMIHYQKISKWWLYFSRLTLTVCIWRDTTPEFVWLTNYKFKRRVGLAMRPYGVGWTIICPWSVKWAPWPSPRCSVSRTWASGMALGHSHSRNAAPFALNLCIMLDVASWGVEFRMKLRIIEGKLLIQGVHKRARDREIGIGRTRVPGSCTWP